jgi:hypothetical protein
MGRVGLMSWKVVRGRRRRGGNSSYCEGYEVAL